MSETHHGDDDREYDDQQDEGRRGGVLDDYAPEGGRRKRKRFRGLPGCLAALVAATLLFGGLYVGVSKGVDLLSSRLASPGDFPGPGRGRVVFEVKEGDTVAEMGRGLKAKGVVRSVDSFISAARGDEASSGIQVGYYELQKEMPAVDALEVLVDPANILKNTVTIPEGLRVTEILDVLAENTDFERAAFQRLIDNPEPLGLPAYAAGNAEGYLFPSTYDFAPTDQPRDMLRKMVDRWRQAAEEADLEEASARLGYTPGELMIIASLIEAEALPPDMPKVSRVIYNRLDVPNDSDTNGLLQIDAAVNYGLQQDLGVGLTQEQLDTPTPYNTYLNPGLPPTPIEAPGDEAIAAAANPADGPWFFYATVDLETGETKFAETYAEFLTFDAELCENAPETC